MTPRRNEPSPRNGGAVPAVRLLLVLVAAAAVTSACQVSVGGGLDIDQIEQEIATGIEDQTGISVTSVECPQDVEAEAGNNFTCTVTAEDGSTATVDVTQEDDEGNVRWNLRQS